MVSSCLGGEDGLDWLRTETRECPCGSGGGRGRAGKGCNESFEHLFVGRDVAQGINVYWLGRVEKNDEEAYIVRICGLVRLAL